MRFLITGATGFVGQHLVRRLHREGHETTLLVREAYGMGHPLPDALTPIRAQLHLVYADLRNYRLTSRAVEEAQPELVIHLAAAGVTNPYLPVPTALRHNVTGTINLLRAAFEHLHSTQRLIVARTPGETEPENPYQASKAAAWKFCQMYARQLHWPINGAVIFQAYGPGQAENTLIPSAFAAATDGRNFPMTSGSQERDWTYIDDVVCGLVTLAENGIEAGKSIDLGTGQTTTVLEVVKTIYAMVDQGGRPLPGALADRPGEAARQVARAQETENKIGWRAATSLSAGLDKMRATTP